MSQESSASETYFYSFQWGAQAPTGQFNDPAGIAADSDGNIYVVDGANDRIQKFDRDGQFITTWGSRGAGAGQFFDAHGIAVDRSGYVYVADTWNRRIQKFTNTGAFVTQWGTSAPWYLAVDSNGYIYTGDGTQIHKFSGDGWEVAEWGSYGSGDGQFQGTSGIAVDSDGYVYVADPWGNCVQKFISDGAFVTKWSTSSNPSGVSADSSGNVYVASYWSHRIQKFTNTGALIAECGGFGTADGQLQNPQGLAVDAHDSVYVVDAGNHRIQKWASNCSLLTKWGSKGTANGQFYWPWGIARTRGGDLLVVDSGNHRIQRFDAEGRFIRAWGGQGSGAGQFSNPMSVAVDNNDNIYVTDANNHRVQVFNSAGSYSRQWGSYGNGNGEFNRPMAIAVDRAGFVYVADRNNHRIQKFTSTGTYVSQWGGPGNGDGQLSAPEGIAVDSAGNVYVADTYNNRVQKFTGDGRFVSKLVDLLTPRGVGVDDSDSLFVVNSGRAEIRKYTASGDLAAAWGWYGSGPGTFDWPSAVTANTDAGVYVVDANNQRVQHFILPAQILEGWRGEYYNNRFLAEAPSLIRTDSSISFDWGTGSPDPRINADNFSARWQRYISFDQGLYRFTVSADDGVRLWVDDRILIEQWQEQGASNSADIGLGAGYHRVRVEYFEAGGGAAVRLSWTTTTIPPDSYEPDDTCSQARSITVNGSAQTHNFHAGSDVDWVKFNATTGTWYEIRTSNLGSDADTVLGLYDADCSTLLTSNDDYQSLASRIYWYASSSTTLYVKARPYGGAVPGPNTSYDLTVNTVPPPPPDNYEPDDACAQARVIAVNGVAQTHNFHTASDLDWVRFDVSVNYRYTLETSNLGENADTVLELCRVDCATRIAQDDDSGPGLGSRIVWDADAGATLYARIRPFNSNHTGSSSNYDFTVTAVALTPLVTPTALSATLLSGRNTTQRLTLGNPGSTPITFTITDVETGVPAQTGRVETLMMPEISQPKGQGLLSANSSNSSFTPSAYRYFGLHSLPHILVYTDDGYLSAGTTYVEQALRQLGLSYTGHYADCAGFGTDLAAGGWDLVLISHNNWYCLGDYWNEVESYLNAGGKAAIETFDIDGSHSESTTLWSTLGIVYAGDITQTVASIYRWVPADSLFTAPQNVPDFTDITDQYFDHGDRVNTIGTTVAKAGFTTSPQANQAGIVVALDRRAIVNSWIVSEDQADLDGDAALDAIELWMNEISYLIGVKGNDAAWLTENPISSSVSPGGTVNVSVSYDATSLAPGVYNATILVTHNGNVISPLTVPITLTVTAPTSTPTPTCTATATATPSPTPTPTATFTPTSTPTPTPSTTPSITPTPTPCPDAFEPDDQWFQAKVLSVGSGAQRHTFHVPGDVDWVKWVAQAGHQYIIRTLDLAPRVDTRLYLYDTDGQVLLTWNDDDPTSPPASRTVWDCPADGTYFVKVSNLDPQAGGCDLAYSIEVIDDVTPTPTSTATPRPGKVYLPVIRRDLAPTPTPSPICDGGFEAGSLEPCWQHGGELGQAVVEQLNVGEPTPTVEPAYAGHYSALLGDPNLGTGLPNQPTIPVGSAWIEQAVSVPDTASPRLSFWYRIITYDVAQDDRRHSWDIFAVEINGEEVFWDGNREPGTSQRRHDLGWRRYEEDLNRWRGQTVTLRFANWNGYSRGPGAELYNTWTYLDEVAVVP